MDKWDAYTNRIRQAALAEEPEAAIAGGLDMLAELGRQIERIGDALEARNLMIDGSEDYPAELEHEEAPELQHDL